MYIDQESPTTNFNDKTRLLISYHPTKGAARGLWKFNIPGTINAAQIQSATLHVSGSIHTGGGTALSVYCYALNSPFAENAETWNTQNGGDYDAGVFSSGSLPSGNDWEAAIDVTTLAKGNLAKLRNNGMLMKKQQEGPTKEYQNIASRETTDPEDFVAYLKIVIASARTTTTTAASTTSTIPVTTSTTSVPAVTTTTIPLPPPECNADADCDDEKFCNGAERCVLGQCLAEDNPCSEGQVCREELKQCLSILRVSARCIPQRVLRPWLRDTRCFWLLVYCPVGSHVNSQSIIMITGPETQAAGVTVNEQRQLVNMAGMLWVPVCVKSDATTGAWKLSISTDADISGTMVNEVINADFTVR